MMVYYIITGLRFLPLSLLIVNCNFIKTGSANYTRAQIHQRVVTSLEDVFNGVPVDYRYNESDTSSVPPVAGLVSVPGCPNSVSGYPWVYFGSPAKCYLAGEKGPCGPSQKLFIEFGSPYGFCNCECFEGMNRSKNANEAEFCKSQTDNREYTFLPEAKKCFSIFDQGPCKTNEWLVKSTSKSNATGTSCEPRKCPYGQIPYYNNDDLDSRNFTCFAPISAFASPVSIIPNNCEQEGMKYSKLLKKCVKKFAFKFG